ncbi:unnamed protein product, partial [Brachionus calyciflorus]
GIQDFKCLLNIFSNCKKIKEIEVVSETFSNKTLAFCFKDQPIKFLDENVTRTGCLTQDGIIKIVSDVVQYIQLPIQDKTLVRQPHETFLASDSQIQYFNIDYLANKVKEPQLSHNVLLLDGIVLLSSFQEVMNHEMTAGTWYTHMSDTSKLIDVKIAIENTIIRGSIMECISV